MRILFLILPLLFVCSVFAQNDIPAYPEINKIQNLEDLRNYQLALANAIYVQGFGECSNNEEFIGRADWGVTNSIGISMYLFRGEQPLVVSVVKYRENEVFGRVQVTEFTTNPEMTELIDVKVRKYRHISDQDNVGTLSDPQFVERPVGRFMGEATCSR